MHYFVVKARNGQIIVTSEDYNSTAAVMNGVASLKMIVHDYTEVKIIRNDP